MWQLTRNTFADPKCDDARTDVCNDADGGIPGCVGIGDLGIGQAIELRALGAGADGGAGDTDEDLARTRCEGLERLEPDPARRLAGYLDAAETPRRRTLPGARRMQNPVQKGPFLEQHVKFTLYFGNG